MTAVVRLGLRFSCNLAVGSTCYGGTSGVSKRPAGRTPTAAPQNISSTDLLGRPT